MAAQFELAASGDKSGDWTDSWGLITDLQLYQAALAYLETSQEVESALLAGHQARVLAALESLKDRNSLAAAMTPNWEKLAQRHREGIRELNATL